MKAASQYYNPVIGRFTSEDSTRARRMNIYDPYGYYQDVELTGGVYRDAEKGQYIVDDPLSLNLYTYCHGNPVRFVDADGHMPSWLKSFGQGFLDFFIGYYNEVKAYVSNPIGYLMNLYSNPLNWGMLGTIFDAYYSIYSFYKNIFYKQKLVQLWINILGVTGSR